MLLKPDPLIMNSCIEIRWCKEEEINWINEWYAQIDFKSSSFDTDRVAIARCDGKSAGLGRLCLIDRLNFELGGMYVDPDFRGFGIARQIVKFLIKNCPAGTNIYCLPFAHLIDFYESEGFREISAKSISNVPKDVLEKHVWCNQTYPHEVLLLKYV